MNNNKLTAVLGTILIVMVAIVLVKVLDTHQTVGASANGVTNSTQRIASLSCNTNISATTTIASFLNSDSNDRLIEGITVWLIPTSTSPIANIEVGTSTGPAGNSATVVAQTTISTTTLPLFIDVSTITGVSSSSQPVFISNAVRSWAANSYLNFTLNATSAVATNIPASENSCLVVVKYAAE